MAKKTSTTKSSSNGKQASSQNDESKLLNKFFVDGLKDIYWAEKALVKALTKMEKKASSDQLKNAFSQHRTQTEQHVSRLEQVFESIGSKAVAKKCEAMDGLIREANDIIDETEDKTMTRDAALIMAAQKVEHYEIATYGSLVQLAKVMGFDDAASLLQQTLEEEKQTDAGLTDIAENNINWEAEMEGGAEEEE